MADLFFLFVVTLIFIYFRGLWNDVKFRKAELSYRRSTLRYDEDEGLYLWTTLDGRSHLSDKHPDQPGGVWYEAERGALEGTRG